MKKQSIFVTALSWILYQMGDLVSRVMFYIDSGTLYTIYNKLMIWGADLDSAGKVWAFPENKSVPSITGYGGVEPCLCCDSHCKKCCGCYIDIGRGKSCVECEKCHKHCDCT